MLKMACFLIVPSTLADKDKPNKNEFWNFRPVGVLSTSKNNFYILKTIFPLCCPGREITLVFNMLLSA